MNKLSAAAQKLKGKAQKAIGDYQMETGNVIKGGISKAKGELNERIGDAKLRSANNKPLITGGLKDGAVIKTEDEFDDDKVF